MRKLFLLLFFVTNIVFAQNANKMGEDITAFGSIAASFTEIIDHGFTDLWQGSAYRNSTDVDVVIRLGSDPNNVMTIKADESITLDLYEQAGKVFLKYRTGAPTSGEFIYNFWSRK